MVVAPRSGEDGIELSSPEIDRKSEDEISLKMNSSQIEEEKKDNLPSVSRKERQEKA